MCDYKIEMSPATLAGHEFTESAGQLGWPLQIHILSILSMGRLGRNGILKEFQSECIPSSLMVPIAVVDPFP
jgi:hypothetical protein